MILDEALHQMRYILSNKERKKVKKSSTLQTEKLFKELWKVEIHLLEQPQMN